MVPYVAVMLPVLVGFALLALDGSRRMSLQTQMQAAADSLALAGARELNKQAGAEARAISAMANAHAATKSSNTLFGVGIVADAGLHVRFLFQPVSGERWHRRLGRERGFEREICRGEDHSADLVNRPSGDVPQGHLDQRIRRRRGCGRGFRRDERVFGRADLRLQPLRRERGIDDRRAGDRGALFCFRRSGDPEASTQAQSETVSAPAISAGSTRRTAATMRPAWRRTSRARAAPVTATRA